MSSGLFNFYKGEEGEGEGEEEKEEGEEEGEEEKEEGEEEEGKEEEEKRREEEDAEITSNSGKGFLLKVGVFWPIFSSVIWEMSTAASDLLLDSQVSLVRSGVRQNLRKWFFP